MLCESLDYSRLRIRLGIYHLRDYTLSLSLYIYIYGVGLSIVSPTYGFVLDMVPLVNPFVLSRLKALRRTEGVGVYVLVYFCVFVGFVGCGL
ncbi:hypothetical protein GGS21DRAFT_525952 [Xylaria nigripes]|nr:hypothetical protein GGS21DRAFT_525952 [Xylaria nigripes]